MPRIEFLGADDDESERPASVPPPPALPLPLPPAKRAKRSETERDPDEETQITAGASKLSLEAIRRSDEGIFAEMKCLVCEKMLGADLEIDDKNLMEWNETYYTLRDFNSPDEMYETLAKQYNRTLADPGEELTSLQVRNHFESNHMLDQHWSLRQSIRNLETVERRMAQHCFTTDSYDPKAIETLLKVTTTKHTLYNTRQKRLA